MLVFVDESGDTGFKEGSTEKMVITLVVFADDDEAQQCDTRIGLLKTELRMNEKFEFHFHSNSDRQRAAFLRAVAPFEFFVYSFCVNKAKLTSDFLHTKDGLYNSICGMLFENARGTLDRAIVKIDKKDDKPFRLELSKYLKKKINKGEGSIQHIKSVSMENSHANNLIQMADMICGAIARRHKTGKKDADWFFNMIRHRIVSEREWPV